MARVLIPLPSTDFDPTESAFPWRTLTAAGHTVTFATPDGQPGQADANARTAYAAMTQSAEFKQPQRWSNLK